MGEDFKVLLTKKLLEKSRSPIQTLADRKIHSPPPALGLPLIPLRDEEIFQLEKLLLENQKSEGDIGSDLEKIKTLTEEIQSINAQGALLHGERIKQAQRILKNYKEGAFTGWLVHTYGNRQTPYNFLQFYELYLLLSESGKRKLLDMPKKAAYILASRTGAIDKKIQIIEEYEREPKASLLTKIRDTFPLEEWDKRKRSYPDHLIGSLSRLIEDGKKEPCKFSRSERKLLDGLLQELQSLIRTLS